MASYLQRIIERKRSELTALRPIPRLSEVLKGEHLRIIAEIKRRSPSKGMLAPIPDPVALARRYIEGGAAAISVLTDEKDFGGSLEDLREVARAFPDVPILRKDFIVDKRQIIETARAGASAILLIAAVLKGDLKSFVEEAHACHLEPLVEVHEETELTLALQSGARIIGINSRNLSTFQVDRAIARQLAAKIPSDRVKVAESGILNGEDAREMRQSGFDAILVGEALVKAEDPAQLLRSLYAD